MLPAPSLAARLGLGFGLVLALLLGLVTLGLIQESRVARLDDRLAGDIATRALAAHRLEQAFFRQAIAFRAYLLRGDQGQRNEVDGAAADGAAALAELRKPGRDARAVHLVEEIAPLFAAFSRGAAEAIARHDAGATAEEMEPEEQRLVELRSRLTPLLLELVELGDDEAIRAFSELRGQHETASRASVVLGIAALAAGIFAAAWVIRPIRRQTLALVGAARALAGGDYRPAREFVRADRRETADELEEVARAFGIMAAELEARERRLAGQARLSRVLAESRGVEAIAAGALGALVEQAGCESGAVYLFDRDRKKLARVAAFAAEGGAVELLPGEGLPGQAAASGRPVIVRDLPTDGPYRLRVGLEDLPARTVAAFPIGTETPLGAVVLAGVRELPDDAFAFAAGACRQLSVSLESALAADEIARLAGALRAINAELEDRNAELQAQSEEIQAQNEELRAQSEEIVAQNEELQRQQQELLAADQAKDEFLSVASHEFKSPIAALKSFCQLLVRRVRGRPEYAELLPMLERIDTQADKVVIRVNRLLDVSRAKMGTLTPAPERLDLVALLRGLVAQAQVRSDRHRLILDTSVDHLPGRWDRLHLEQAIGNLLDNAVRYSPKGGEVRVELRVENGEAHVAIRDQGIGMSEETRARLFQPYFRAEAARRVAADGMGIGLYVSREMVALQGGRIAVESRPGLGSTFRIELPLSPSTATSAA